MREIKFRYWTGKQMSRGFTLQETTGKERWDILIPMQYTGLKDKNGTDIYEGDILSAGDFRNARKVFVEWCPIIGSWVDGEKGEAGLYYGLDAWGKAKGPSPFSYEGLISRWLIIARDSDHPKIIGNIYENPDLLTSPLPHPYKGCGRMKAKRTPKEQAIVNNTLRHMDPMEGMRGSHEGCIKISKANTFEHEYHKFLQCWNLLQEGIPFYTEAKFKEGGRCDIINIRDGEIIEIATTESDESLKEKRKKYPGELGIKIVRTSKPTRRTREARVFKEE